MGDAARWTTPDLEETVVKRVECVIQPALVVGAAHDPLEREADRVADAVMRRLEAPPPSGDDEAALLRRVAEHAGSIGLDGGTADAATDRAINSSRGASLDAATQSSMEAAFRTDFGSVRIHTGPTADDLNERLGARAFTTGSDVFVRSSDYSPRTAGGQRLIAHELTHVVQQRGGLGRSTVQRKVGFELEEGAWHSYVATVEGDEGDETPEQPVPRGRNVIEPPPRYHVNDDVADAGAKAATPGEVLHRGKGFNVEADGPYAGGHTDIEFVTKPFTEDDSGSKALTKAVAGIRKIMERLTALPDLPRSRIGEFILQKEHKFSRKDVFLWKGDKKVGLKVQVTHGVPLATLPSVMEYFGAAQPDETEREAEERSGSRQLTPDVFAKRAMGAAPRQADVLLSMLTGTGVFGPQDDLAALRGFLSYVLMYAQSIQAVHVSGFKWAVPLLSRYDLATLFRQLPDDQQRSLSMEPGLSTFVDAFGATLREIGLTAPGRTYPLTTAAPLMEVANASGDQRGFADMMEKLTLGDWLVTLLSGVDLLEKMNMSSFLEEIQEPVEDLEASVHDFLRGHGSTKTLVDAEDDLAIVENRLLKPAGGDFDMAQAEETMFAYFRLMVHLATGGPRAGGDFGRVESLQHRF